MLIKELFAEYIEYIPNSVGKGEVLRLDHTKDMKKLFVYAAYEQIQNSEYIIDFEKNIAKAMELQEIGLRCRYKPNLFSEKALPSLVEHLRRNMYVINGHLKGAIYTVEDGKVTVIMKGAGWDMLKKAGFEEALAKLIREEYQLNTVVELRRAEGESSTDDDYSTAIRNIYENMPVEAPPENPAAAFDKDISVEELVTVNYKDLPILSDGAEIIKGRKIDSPVINIADITGKVSNVTVWGDCFDYSEREIRTKNGNKRVVSLSITDYTSSISIKSFENIED
ncbi:MAG: hypothetical protein ACI4JF_00775, partial [Oscillospiraceae bacterium]